MKTSDLIDKDETAPTSAAPPQAERSVSESSPVRLTKTPPPSEKIARLQDKLGNQAPERARVIAVSFDAHGGQRKKSRFRAGKKS